MLDCGFAEFLYRDLSVFLKLSVSLKMREVCVYS